MIKTLFQALFISTPSFNFLRQPIAKNSEFVYYETVRLSKKFLSQGFLSKLSGKVGTFFAFVLAGSDQVANILFLFYDIVFRKTPAISQSLNDFAKQL